jgi:hypothetical protein
MNLNPDALKGLALKPRNLHGAMVKDPRDITLPTFFKLFAMLADARLALSGPSCRFLQRVSDHSSAKEHAEVR